MSSKSKYISLFHYRWGVPIISELYALSGAKLVTLTQQLDINRGSAQRTLDELSRQEWIIRNPGYGHPMRPEYILTSAGKLIAPMCIELMNKLNKLRVIDIGLRKWSMPIIHAMCNKHSHFSEFRRFYPDLTARALATTLKDLLAMDLIKRVVLDTYPPDVCYQLTKRSQFLCPNLKRLEHLVTRAQDSN